MIFVIVVGLAVALGVLLFSIWRRPQRSSLIEVHAPSPDHLVTRILNNVKCLKRPYLPHFLLRNTFTQLFLGEVHRPGPHADFDRVLFRLPDGGTVGLDFANKVAKRDAPIVLILHGGKKKYKIH